MGASGWQYFTRYRPRTEDALQELRQRVFDNREFLRSPVSPAGSMKGLGLGLRLLVMLYRIVFWARQRRLRRARSIDEAVELAAEEGTHSILDVYGVARVREIGVAAPAPQRWLEEIYGATRPTRAQVEQNAGEFDERLERGQCVYVVVYRDGEPDEIYFKGNSGD